MENLHMLQFKKATVLDIDVLTKTRIQVLRAANRLSASVDMSEVEKETRTYYKKAMIEDSHVAILVYDEEKFVGAGGVSFYTVMPTFHNSSGRKAYIMNMYTDEEYRRKGIAYHTLDMLIEECRKRGISDISLEATKAGRPLYEKYGFVMAQDEMVLPRFHEA